MSKVIYCDQDTKLIDGELVSKEIPAECHCPKHNKWVVDTSIHGSVILEEENSRKALMHYTDSPSVRQVFREIADLFNAVDNVVATFRGPVFNKVQDEDLREKLVTLRNTREKFF